MEWNVSMSMVDAMERSERGFIRVPIEEQEVSIGSMRKKRIVDWIDEMKRRRIPAWSR